MARMRGQGREQHRSLLLQGGRLLPSELKRAPGAVGAPFPKARPSVPAHKTSCAPRRGVIAFGLVFDSNGPTFAVVFLVGVAPLASVGEDHPVEPTASETEP